MEVRHEDDTVGDGDRYPVTNAGRLVGDVLMTLGVGLFGVLTGYLATAFVGSKHASQAEILNDTSPPETAREVVSATVGIAVPEETSYVVAHVELQPPPGTNEHEQPKHADAHETWIDRDRPDDSGGDEYFQPDQDGTSEVRDPGEMPRSAGRWPHSPHGANALLIQARLLGLTGLHLTGRR